jgi:hypothetical protein
MPAASADCKMIGMSERSISITLELDPCSDQIRGLLSHRGSRRPFVGWLALASEIEATRQEQDEEDGEGDA